MNFVILSIYDSWYAYSININGKLFIEDSKIAKEIYHIYWNSDDWNGEDSRKVLYDYLLKKFKGYDLIAICEDGDCEILKGGKKND